MDMPDTFFAPAHRASDEDVRALRKILDGAPYLSDLLESFPGMAVALNLDRQIIMSNRQFLAALGNPDPATVVGKRFGEAVGCVNAWTMKGGCGTSEKCSTCGAVKSILTAIEGQQDIQECRIAVGDKLDQQNLEYRVWSTPVTVEGQQVIMLAATDISGEKRRQVLERLFFHDVLNTAGGIKGVASLFSLIDTTEMPELAGHLEILSDRLIEEITQQRALTMAENGELQVDLVPVQVRHLLDNLCFLYSRHEAGAERHIRCHAPDQDSMITTDPVLLGRVLGNLIKNALEASRAGETVTVSAMLLPDAIRFSVHNPAFMPREVQLQLFLRSFSTKGQGRGIGTYSIKLITERYLRGRVSFESTEQTGTTFHVTLPLA